MITQTFFKPLEGLDKDEKIELAHRKMYDIISTSMEYFDQREVRAVPGDYYNRKTRNAFCRKVWNNTSQTRDFDYLYGSIDKRVEDPDTGAESIIKLTPPARVRHIPMVRPILESLVSRMNERPLRPRVYSVGTEAVEQKLERYIERLAEMRMAKLRERMMGVNMMSRAIQLQEQLLAQMEQQQQQQPDPRIEQVLPQIQQAIAEAKMIAEKSIRITDEEHTTVSNYYKYSYRDLYEQATEGMLYEYIDRHRLNTMRVDGFREKMITDETYIGIWWDEGMLEPYMNIVRPEQITYPISDSADYVRDLDYCVIHTPMSYLQIIQMWGHKLTKEQAELIKSDTFIYSYGNIQPFSYGTTVWDTTLPDGRSLSTSSDYYNMRNQQISVYRTFWKEVVKMRAIEKQYEDGTKYYEPVPEGYSGGGKIVYKRRTELWTGITVGYNTRIHIEAKKSTWQPRPFGKPGSVYLPIAGKAVTRYHQPNSAVWSTRDIQDLFDILHYQEEKLVVLSGVRGIVYDLSQKPESMDEREVIYYMKQGILFIETLTNGNRKNQSFNQYQTYDQTIAPAVQVITAIKQSLVDLVRMITGVAPQLQGQIAPTDQVGTSQMALAMSTASVEYLFQEDGVVWQQALDMLANLFPTVYRDKGARKIRFDGTKQQIVSYPKEVEGEFASVVDSGSKAQESLQRAKAGIDAAYQKGVIGIGQLIQLQDLQSIHDIQVAISDFEDKARKMAEQQQQAAQQQQMSIQQQAAQLLQQNTLQIEQFKGQMAERLAQLQGQIEMQKESVKAQQQVMALQQQAQEEQMKDQTKRYDIDMNTMIEASYLQLEKQKVENETATSRLDRTLSHIEANMKFRSDARKSKGKAND